MLDLCRAGFFCLLDTYAPWFSGEGSPLEMAGLTQSIVHRPPCVAQLDRFLGIPCLLLGVLVILTS